jgi:hypothetical protein
MLVLLGPPFQGSDDEYSRLAQATGILAYELRTKIKPNAWGVVRALGDEQQALDLAATLVGLGFRVSVVDPAVAADPDRLFVPLRTLELTEGNLVLHLSERSMPIPYQALTAIVRGEVHIGVKPRAEQPSSSSTFRAVVPSARDIEVFRESSSATRELDAYAAVDLHFATVLWAARVDVRSFDFSPFGGVTGTVADLDRVAELVAERSGVRIDRAARVSSLASFTSAGPQRPTTPPPGQVAPGRREIPERFDAYSRLVAEAERRAARLSRSLSPPPR